MSNPSLEERSSPAGTAYRAGLVLQLLGAGILAVLYPMDNPFYTAGIMLFDLGVLTAGIFLRISSFWIKLLLLCAVLVGLPLQVLGTLVAPPEHAGTVILAGVGLVCVSAAGMAGKEAYCFAFREGWLLMGSLPLIIIINLFFREHRIVNSLSFSAVFLLLFSLTRKKLGRAVPAACATDRSPAE